MSKVIVICGQRHSFDLKYLINHRRMSLFSSTQHNATHLKRSTKWFELKIDMNELNPE